MTIEDFEFNPAQGLKDTNFYPDNPADPRGDIQGLMNQIRDFLTVNVVSNLNSLLPLLAPQTYTAPTLLSGWANLGLGNANAGYLKDPLGYVRCTGGIANGAIANGTVIFNLPAGYRPLASKAFACASNGASGVTILRVTPNGDVSIYAGGNSGYTSLDNICFKAEQ